MLKLRKYMKAGVREYWLVNPEKRNVIVYTNCDGIVLPAIYTFEDKVTVVIWDGKCEVDFSQIDTEL